ncbi:MAG: VCBS repeat-containing protein [Chloracidobacterium sp.]|nr:VCBS repeat-containing protein [Chloracidobacterium sp.]
MNTKSKIITTIAIIFATMSLWQSVRAVPGDLDTTFAQGGIARWGFGGGSDGAYAVAVQPDGKLIVAGTSSNGAVVARYNTDGSLDTSIWTSGRSFDVFLSRGEIAAVKVQTDGKIVVAGTIVSDFAVTRFNTDGSLDSSFGFGGRMTTSIIPGLVASSMAIQPDGKIIVAGSRITSTREFFALVRLNIDGSLDNTFDTDGVVTTTVSAGTDRASAVMLQGTKILVVGTARPIGLANFAIVRYNSDGSLDSSFDTDGIVITNIEGGSLQSYATAVGLLPGNPGTGVPDRIVVGGSSQTNKFAAARYNLDGSLDTSFDGDGKVTVQVGSSYGGATGMLIQASGSVTRKVILTGFSSNIEGQDDFELVRLNLNGSLDTTFDGDGRVTTPIGSSTDIANATTYHEGKIALVGYSWINSDDFALARYNLDGSLDTTFDTDGKRVDDFGSLTARAKSLAIQPDGKIVAAGLGGLMRFNGDGTLDDLFDGDGRVSSFENNGLAIQPDGKIVTVSYLAGIGGFNMTRYNSNGSVDISVATVVGTSETVATATAIQSDGKIVVAGYTVSPGNDSDFAVVRYNSNGTLDSSFDGDGKLTTDFDAAEDLAKTVAIQSDGKIVVAGKVGGAFGVSRYTTNGSLDSSFGINGKAITPAGTITFGDCKSVAIQSDGKIIVAGSANNPSDFALVRFNSNGSLDTSFDGDGFAFISIGVGSDGANSIVIEPSGKILVAGFADSGTNSDFAIVRFNSNGSLDSSYGIAGKVILNIFVSDIGNAIVLDSLGRAVVAGEAGGMFGLIRLQNSSVRTKFDFDGDSKTDISIFRPNLGEWWYLKSSNGGNAAFQFGAAADKVVPADYTGDGRADVAFWRPSTGFWYILRSEDNSFFAFPFGANGDTPVPADYDGDGKDDPAVFRQSSQTWFIQKSSGGTDIISFGAAGDKPVIADYDGDGKADIAIFRPNGIVGSEWWIRRSSNGSVYALQFGTSADKPMQGDYTGDGKADVAFWRPSNGNWFILRSEDLSFYAFPFGTNGDIPLSGDYDGDGKSDPAVFRPSSNNWFVQRSTAGTLIQQFGIAGDLPVPNVFVP